MVSRPAVLRTTKPKRQLNAYNFFFSKERERLLKVLPVREDLQHSSKKPKKGHGKIEFQELAQLVSANWKKAPQHYKDYCLELSKQDRIRFEREMQEYQQTRAYLEQMERLQQLQKQEGEPTLVVVRDEEQDFDWTPLPLYTNAVSEDHTSAPDVVDYPYSSYCLPETPGSMLMSMTMAIEPNRILPSKGESSSAPSSSWSSMGIKRLAQKLDRESQDILIRAFLGSP